MPETSRECVVCLLDDTSFTVPIQVREGREEREGRGEEEVKEWEGGKKREKKRGGEGVGGRGEEEVKEWEGGVEEVQTRSRDTRGGWRCPLLPLSPLLCA